MTHLAGRTARTAFTLGLAVVMMVFGLTGTAFADVRCTGTIGDRQIDDNVRVPSGESCTLQGTDIDGNVLIGRDARLTADNITVGGNIQDDNGDARRITVRSSTVGGSVQLEDGRGAIELDANVVDGDVQLNANTGGVNVVDNTIGGNLQCQSNDPAPTGGGNVVSGDAEGQCSDLEGSSGPDRPDATARPTDDSCPDDDVPEDGFDDADDTVHEGSIDCAVWWDVAQGTSASTYTPNANVDRDQMASFIARLITESDGALPDPTRDHFADDDGNTHEANINRLAEAGIVGGTSDGAYSPNARVRRDQMATFLIRAYEYRTGQSLPAGDDYFADDEGNRHESNINKAAEAGFTAGTQSGGYQPADAVQRAPMASFLTRPLDLLVEAGFTQTPDSSSQSS